MASIAASFCRWASSVLLLAAAACQPPGLPPDSGAREAATLYRVNDDEVRTLDPHKVSVITDMRLADDLFEGLTDIGPDGRVMPGLAAGWTTSADGLVWTFRLRPGLRFSDGRPLDAHDVIWSLRRMMDPATASPYAAMYAAISGAPAVTAGTAPPATLGIAAPDAATVVIRLTRPWPPLDEVLAAAPAAIVPRHAIERFGDKWIKPGFMVSSGPFRLARWVLHSDIVLVRNRHYHDAAGVRLDRVVYLPVSEDHSAVRRFRAGEVDILETFPENLLPVLRRDMPEAVRLAPYRGVYYWVFNTRKPPFDDARIRRALALAVDREMLVRDVLRMPFRPAWSVVPPGTGGYGEAQTPDWAAWPRDRRLAQARQLLQEAGISPDHPLDVEVRFNSDEGHRRIAVAIAQMWAPLGIRLSLFNAESAVHFRALKAGEFAVARSGWIGDFDSAETFLFQYAGTTGALNYSGYASRTFDAALERALDESDPDARNRLFSVAERLMLADMPVLPLYFYVSRALISPDVRGWQNNAAGVHGSRYLAVVRRQPGKPA